MQHLAPLFVFLSSASVALFSFIAVAVWAAQRRREREAFYRSETVRRLAETQGAGATAAIEYLREEEKIAAKRRSEGQKLGGMVLVAVGLGLMVFIGFLDTTGTERAYLVGIIPMFIGMALLASTYFASKKTNEN